MGKRCYTCKQYLPLEDFSKDKSRKDGFAPRCKKCWTKYNNANKEKKAEYNTKYYRNNKNKIIRQNAIYNENNRDKINKRQRKYNKNNKEEIAKRLSKYKSNNRDKLNNLSAKRKAIKRNQTPIYADLKIIQLYYAVCNETNEILGDTFFHVDHIQPLSKGGLHHEDNLQILESFLNIQKKDKWPLTDEEQIKYNGVTLN